jgi:Glu-tRNA(Gln) amidotransferase subunit E-like FAD-binding protein
LRAIAGETGKIDQAAKFEMKKSKVVKYEACSTSSCLVEMDEEPPHEVNIHALKIALEVALLFKARVFDEIHFMRKTVVDGSNVSGFQRTALVAVDGYINTSKGIVRIDTICLEEEAAKKLEDGENFVKYRLDRLGVPLVEIATDASIQDPEHAKEVASIIGMVLRSTGKVKRGIGTIRQDVNVSVSGHPRVEIKGFQELRYMPKVIENEVIRQKSEKNGESHVRKANADGTTTFMRPMPGAARMYPETDISLITNVKDILKEITLPELIDEKALRLEKKYGISAELARGLVEEEIDLENFKFKTLEMKYVANVLVNYSKEIQSRFNLDASKLSKEDFKEVLGYLDEGKISKEAVLEILVELLKGNKIDLTKYKALDANEVEKIIKKLVEENPNLTIGALMGDAMKILRGKVDGKVIMDLLKKHKQ